MMNTHRAFQEGEDERFTQMDNTDMTRLRKRTMELLVQRTLTGEVAEAKFSCGKDLKSERVENPSDESWMQD